MTRLSIILLNIRLFLFKVGHVITKKEKRKKEGVFFRYWILLEAFSHIQKLLY